MSVGERLKRRRKELGMSAEAVAEKLGVSPSTVYRYESGEINKMGIDKLKPIAISIHALLTESDRVSPSFSFLDKESISIHIPRKREKTRLAGGCPTLSIIRVHYSHGKIDPHICTIYCTPFCASVQYRESS